ncbi:hypothetical protein A6A08_06900 [Nocardiopsis sp. TSRI0078]|nr:hypothetical protein A6A08_06900 [Nocardiopsis sp. TSRI0078]
MTTTRSEQGTDTVTTRIVDYYNGRERAWAKAASIASMRLLLSRLRHRAGPSTGTNLGGAMRIVAEMLSDGERGSVVRLMCDQGERYMRNYYDDAWVEQTLKLDLAPYTRALEDSLSTGRWNEPAATAVPAARKA